MVEVYIHPHVTQIKSMYFDVMSKKESYSSVRTFIEDCVDLSFQNYQNNDSAFAIEFLNYNPDFFGQTQESLLDAELAITDFRKTLAKAYSFKDWEEVITCNHTFNPIFEVGVDWLLAGEFKRLIQLINSKPHILTACSPFGHKAGLIHYCGSNGVEIWRQVVPSNLPQMLDYLIENGADPNQPNHIYGTNSSLIGLIETSAHPYKAGLVNELLAVLKNYKY